MSKDTFAPTLSSGLGTAASSATNASSTASMADLMPKQPQLTSTQATKPGGSKTSISKDGSSKRRGPDSHRVRNMFDSITESRIPLDDVINKHNVSVHVARQSKRFDPFIDRGQVMIKTLPDDDGSKRAYIWRVPSTGSI